MAKNAAANVSADIEALDSAQAETDEITLVSGTVVKVERLKTRGMFKLLRIVTRGAGPILMNSDLNFDSQEEFVGQLLAIVVMAIPEAEQETIEFLQSMVTPADFNERPRTKADQQHNEELMRNLLDELDDPDIDDTISIIEKIIRNEAHDIQALGKRLGSVLRTQMPKTNSPEVKN